ncbi:MAG: hypothetical protein NVS2B16_08870 [Chloroflexota bacterium]
MNTLRLVGIVALAIVIAVLTMKVLAIAFTIFLQLVALLFFAGVLFLCFLVARSTLGKRGHPRQTH